MRDGFVFYRSFYEASKPLNKDDKLALYESIFEFGLNQNETKREPMVNAMFMLIKPQLEANNKRYENGKNGGRPLKEKTETKPKHNQSITKTEPKEKEKEKEKEKVNDKEKKFTYNLGVKTSYSNLSSLYKQKLKEDIELFNGKLSYDNFVLQLESKGYKYANFLSAYKNWETSAKDKPINKSSYKTLEDLPMEERMIEAERIRQEKEEANMNRILGL